MNDTQAGVYICELQDLSHGNAWPCIHHEDLKQVYEHWPALQSLREADSLEEFKLGLHLHQDKQGPFELQGQVLALQSWPDERPGIHKGSVIAGPTDEHPTAQRAFMSLMTDCDPQTNGSLFVFKNCKPDRAPPSGSIPSKSL